MTRTFSHPNYGGLRAWYLPCCGSRRRELRVTETARSHRAVAHCWGGSPTCLRKNMLECWQGGDLWREGWSLSWGPRTMSGTATLTQVRANWERSCPLEVTLGQGRAARHPWHPNTHPGFPCQENWGESCRPQSLSWDEAMFCPRALVLLLQSSIAWEAAMIIKLYCHLFVMY